jgi:hypothetical protein
MIITFELLNDIIDDNIIEINVNTKLNNVLDLKLYLKKKYNFKNISIYENNIKLNNIFNKWNKKNNYYIYIENDIFIFFQINNKITPYFNINTSIQVVKDLLSIDNIYFNNIKLNNNKTLSDYNINNNDKLSTHVVSFISCDI